MKQVSEQCSFRRNLTFMYNTYITNNVTGRHRGKKQKLRAGYRAPSLYNGRHVATSFIVECGIARFFCAMRVYIHLYSP